MTDLIDELVGIAPGDPLDAIRAQRPDARANAQASYDALLAPRDIAHVSIAERFAIAFWSAAISRSSVAAHYRARLASEDPAALAAIEDALPEAFTTGPYGAYPPGPLSVEDEPGLEWRASDALRERIGDRLAAALEHAHLLTFHPRDSSPEALESLLAAGWSTTGVVTLSQLVAFVHFQLRVVAGLTVLREAQR